MTRLLVAIALAPMAVTVAPHASATPDDQITLTFIRHGQSAGNTSGLIDTSTPGPGLTDLGRTQARQVAEKFADDGWKLVDWNGTRV